MNPKVHSCLLFLMLISAGLLSVASASSQYVITQFNQRTIGPANRINGVFTDHTGFVWLATFDGLVRFDGASHVLFDASDHPALLGGVYALAEGEPGTIWTLSTSGSLIRLRSGKIHTWPMPSAMAVERIGVMQMLPNGRPLIADQDGFLTIDDDDAWVRFLQYSWGDDIPDFYEIDAMGSVWVGTRTGRIFRFQDGSMNEVHYDLPIAAAPRINGMAAFEDGSIIISINGQLAVANARSAQLEIIPAETFLLADRRLRFSRLGTGDDFWVSSISGVVYRIEKHNGTYSAGIIQLDTSGPHMVNSIELLPDGRVHIGTYDRGLLMLFPRSGRAYSVRDGLHGPIVNAIIQTPDDNGLLIAHSLGLSWYFEGTFTPIVNEWLSHSEYLIDAFKDNMGRVWISRLALVPIVREADGTWRQAHEFEGLDIGGFRSFAQDREGTLWVGAERGIARLQNGQVSTFTAADGLNSEFILSLYPDSDGRLWIGTARAGLHLLQDGVIRRVDPIGTDAIPAPRRTVFGMMGDDKGQIWGGITGGVFLVRDGTVRFLDLFNHLGSSSFYHAVSDGKGYIWLTTSRGLLRLVQSELEAAMLAGDPELIRNTRLLTSADGLPGDALRANCRIHRAVDGTIWFGLEQGLFGLNPEQVHERPRNITTRITDIQVEGASFALIDHSAHRTLSVPAQNARIQIRYTAPVFIEADSALFSVQLEGFDPDWRITPNRFVEYTNLRPGNYRFRVRLADSDPNNTALESILLLQIPPLFWQTPWFIAGLILVALAMIALSFKLRTRYLYQQQVNLRRIVDLRTHEIQHNHELLKESHKQLAALNQEKNEILSIVAHDLRNPLGALESIAVLLKDEIEQGNVAEVQELLNAQFSSARQMRELIDQLLNDNKLEQGLVMASIEPVDVSALFRQVAIAFKHQLSEKQLRLDTSAIPVDSVWASADPVLLRQVLDNLISNAIKFSNVGKTVWLAVDSCAETIQLLVRDEGPGLSIEDQRKLFKRYARLTPRPTAGESSLGLGLYISRKMVKLMGGEISCESQTGKGAVFRVQLMAASAHTVD